MKRTYSVITLACWMVMGCGGADDPASSSQHETLACGSAQLTSDTHDACGVMDAVGVPDDSGAACGCLLGFAWDGTQCTGLGNCACQGADCDKLTETPEECEALHSACVSPPPVQRITCGTMELHAQQHDNCQPMDAKASPDESGSSCYCFLGFSWNGTECEGLADCVCEGADCDKLTDTKEECEAKHNSCNPVVVPQRVTCGSVDLFAETHEACAPMAAQAVSDPVGGPCDCFLGFAWNGSECVDLADCACEGPDCDKLTDTKEECEARHAECLPPPQLTCGSLSLYANAHGICAPMDATAAPDASGVPCNCFLGFAWDGDACVGLADCQCVGADCDKLTQSLDACEARHAACS